jgi:hypothetical protein
MQGNRWFFAMPLLALIALMTNISMAGVEPSPFDDLLPIIKDFRAEIAKAEKKVERFDLSAGRDLVMITHTRVSVPTMMGLAKDMSSKVGVIGDSGTKVEVGDASSKAGIIGDSGTKTGIKDRSNKTGIIGDFGTKNEVEARIRSINKILATQKNNRRDKASAQDALSQMAKILDQMEDLIKTAKKPARAR